MKKYILTFLLFLLICSCGYAQQKAEKNKAGTTIYKTTLKPLRVYSPVEIAKINKTADSSLQLIISEDTITANLNRHSTQLEDVNSLNKFLIDNKTKIDKTKITIVKHKDGPVDKFNEVVSCLNKNGITTVSVLSF